VKPRRSRSRNKATRPDDGGLKRFLALARVSSREQEREGWSLAHQEGALHAEAKARKGTVVKLFSIAETASRSDERKTFKALIAYAVKHKNELDGILFYKVDRAARNLFDYVELERLELQHDLPFFSTSQPTDNTPAGRIARRMLAMIAAFYTEQQSEDVRDGQKQRVSAGLFVGLAPYGYKNVRIEMRGLIEVDPVEAAKVNRVFHLYAYQNLTVDMIVERLANEEVAYTDATPRWPASTVHKFLRDRSYIGEVFYQDVWYPGVHAPLVDRPTFERVQVLLGGKLYRSHQLTYAGELIKCGHCGRPITGEAVTKPSGKTYTYYRCTRYTAKGHPPVRVTEAALDKQVVALFEKMRLPDPIRDWFGRTLLRWTQDTQNASRSRADELQRQMTALRQQQDKLLNLHLLGEIETHTFSEKNTELRDRIATSTLQIEATQRGRDEHADLARKAFELSQSLQERWFTADYAAKRHILEIICLNFTLDGATLVPQMRKPFDVIVEGLSVQSSRGDRI
jgi:site-specific DNA recombinase